MSVIKCKMCGGDLDISEGLSVCECEYCGTKQTVPTADNEKKLTLFGRANRLRLANEFDKAAGAYESIVADFPEEAEAYWGLVLCRYGIEYVDDPATGKKIPTCHRVSFDSVMEDSDFEQACENADAIARRQYRDEAKQFEDIRRGIIEVSGKEAPYDIFICYKETAEDGDRTIDSVIAQDVYDALTDKGYRVFFSRISLEDKLGTEYEPYIFAALNSAKIMLAFGTDYEYYNAVWVKNEWSRFLKLMEKDKSKHLIPCYKNLDPYDMPKEFQRLQGQDMGKVGAVQDLLRGIEKILPRKQEQPIQPPIQAGSGNSFSERGMLFLEDGEYSRAEEYFEKALDANPKESTAYLGKFLTALQVATLEEAEQKTVQIDSNRDYSRALQFANPTERDRLERFYDVMQRKWLILCLINGFKNLILFREDEERAERERREAEERAEKEEKLRQAAVQATKIARQQCKPVQGLIDVGEQHLVGLQSDGTAIATGSNKYGQCNIGKWTEITAIAAGDVHTVGLKSDGTVLAVGNDLWGKLNVGGWTDIKAIAAGGTHTVGLHTDGTVVAEGDNSCGQCNVSGWRNIVAIAAGNTYTLGLQSDGKVLVTGNNYGGRCAVSSWRNIVAVVAGAGQTVGLREDGTVVATRFLDNNDFYGFGMCDVSSWTEIVDIAVGRGFIAGLKSDGKVLITGKGIQRFSTGKWQNIVAISARETYLLGLQADGIVVAEHTDETIGNVNGWKLFNSLETLEQERKEAAEHVEQERKEAAERAERERKEAAKRVEEEKRKVEERRQARISDLTAEETALNTELANLKGLFSGKRRKEIEMRLTTIEAELKKL